MLQRRIVLGSVGVLAILLATVSVAWACVPKGHVAVSPTEGAVGTKVTVTGSGYPPLEKVEIRWNSRTGPKLGEAVGPDFSVQITIPSAAAGVHYVTAAVTGEHAIHSEATAPFKITTTAGSPGPQQPSGPGAEKGKTIRGTSAGETLVGTAFADVIRCGGGNDRVRAGGGNDVIFCASGNDYIDAGAGTDAIMGGTGRDRLAGGPGNDLLLGQAGNDRLFGGQGNDRLTGGRGRDRLFGGGGRDILMRDGADLLSGGSGRDRIVGGGGGHHHGGGGHHGH